VGLFLDIKKIYFHGYRHIRKKFNEQIAVLIIGEWEILVKS